MSVLYSRLHLLRSIDQSTWAQVSAETVEIITLAMAVWVGSACLDAVLLPRKLKIPILVSAACIGSLRWVWEAFSKFEAWSANELCFWDTCLPPRKVFLT